MSKKEEEKPTGETINAPEILPGNDEIEEPIVKSGFKKVRIKDMRGSFGTAKFDDNCEAEVSEDTLTLLHKHFPNAEVEFLD